MTIILVLLGALTLVIYCAAVHNWIRQLDARLSQLSPARFSNTRQILSWTVLLYTPPFALLAFLAFR